MSTISIEHDLEQLSAEDHGILETASVAGTVFSSAEVMAGMDGDVDGIETAKLMSTPIENVPAAKSSLE